MDSLSRPIPLLLVLFLGACPAVPATGTIEGTVEDLTGAPIVGAEAQLDADHLATTDETGHFVLELPAEDLQRVLVTHPGYVSVARRIDVLGGEATTARFVLQHEATAIRVDAVEAGFEVTGARNAGLAAPPNAFVHADGTPVTGAVDVVLTPFDPSVPAELDAFPGELRGIRLGGSEVILESWGVVDAVVRQGEEILQVAEGQMVTLSVPPPGDGRTPPESIATWYFDEDQTAWVEVGTADLDAMSGLFVADVPHLTPYNCDQPIVPGCIRGMVRDADGNGIFGAQVTVLSNPRSTVSYDFTEFDGYYCLYVERNSELTIEVRTPGIEGCPVEQQDRGYCVTTRTARSGAAGTSGAYPASCDRNCTVIAPSIEVGSPDPGPNPPGCTTATSSDPFGGVCGEALTTMFTCWAPMGTCEYAFEEGVGGDGGTMTLEYANGATAMSTSDPFSGYAMIYTNAAGMECGRVVSGLFGGAEYRLPGGRTVTLDVAEDGTTTVSCEGRTETLSAAQLDTISTCAPSITARPGAAPTQVGGCRPREGTIGGLCRSGAFCDADYECCSRVGDEPTCQPNGLCDALCDSDLDCTLGTQCCEISGYSVCVDPRGCVSS